MRRLGVSLVFVAALCASPALAADEGWKLKDTSQRYDLDLQSPPFKLPDGVTIPTTFTVTEASFKNGRTPAFPLTGPGDLVWYYLLALPEGSFKNLRVVPVDDSFPVKGGNLIVKGERKLKRRSKKLTITTELKLSTDVKGHPLSDKGADLTVVSVFDLKRGLMREATMKLVAPVVVAGQPGSLRWSGEAKPTQQLEVGKASFHVAVEKSIELGRAYLLRKTHELLASLKANRVTGNQLLGRMAVNCFALLRSGVPAQDLRGEFDWMAAQPLEETYSVSLWIMALEARSIQRETIRPRKETRSVARFERGEVKDTDKRLIEKAVKWLLDTRKDGWWNYKGILVDPKRPGDRSNAQFAILALHSAAASGVEVPREAWEEVIKEVLGGQEASGPAASLKGSEFAAGSPFANGDGESGDDGGDGTRVRPGQDSETGAKKQDTARGWAYGSNVRPALGTGYGSMTAAGVSSLAVAREALGGSGSQSAALKGTLQALRDGLAWLASRFDVEANPGKEGHYYYWLYSLEKAMDTTGVERLAAHEWWREAAAALLTRQAPDGRWGEVKDLHDTALALLVLNRATLPAQLTIEAVGRKATGEAAAWDQVAVEGVGSLSARQLLSAMAQRPETAAKRLKLAQKVLPLVEDEQRPRLISRLAALLKSEHKPTKRWAAKACKDMADTDDPQKLAAFAKSYTTLRRMGEARDTGGIPKLRAVLGGDELPPALFRLALLVTARLRAVELLPEVVDRLKASRAEDRQLAWDCLTSLAGGEPHPYDPKASSRKREEQVDAWRGWASDEGSKLLEQETLRRALAELGRGGARADAAASALRERGEEAWPYLADALLDDETRARAHGLLKSMTKANLPPDAERWRRWIKGDRTKEPLAADPGPTSKTPTSKTPKTSGTKTLPTSAPGRERWGLVPRPSQGSN